MESASANSYPGTPSIKSLQFWTKESGTFFPVHTMLFRSLFHTVPRTELHSRFPVFELECAAVIP
jgi:hypothetical protein